MRTRGDTLIDESLLATSRSADIVLDFLPRLAVQCNVGDTTPGGQSFPDTDVDVVQDRIYVPAHGFPTGLKGQFTTTGTLPGGLSLGTDYWLIRESADTFQVATSLADAEAYAPALINSQGAGTHTFTPAAFAGCALKLMSSVDGTNYVDLPSTLVTVSAPGTTIFNVVEPAYRHLKVVFEPIAGAVSLKAVLNGYSSFALTE